MLTSCRRMFAPKRSSTPQSRHSRRDAAVDRQNMELPITLLADHPLQLGNFTSAHLGTFKSALTHDVDARQMLRKLPTVASRRLLSTAFRSIRQPTSGHVVVGGGTSRLRRDGEERQ